MAFGVLLLLVGDENKNKKKYEDLQKVYDIEILLGFSTDTYDILGKIDSRRADYKSPDLASIKRVLKSFEGRFDQEYPPYSSKTVNGKPMYYYARENLLSKIEKPTKRVEIDKVSGVSKREISGLDLLALIERRITLVKGDFRQKEIIRLWRKSLKDLKDREFGVVSLTVKCSSGTYMRSLANNFGKKMGIPTLSLSINRISIGDFGSS